MDRDLSVFMDLNGRPLTVGRLWVRVRHGRETATFTYDEAWLARHDNFPLSPELPLAPGAYQCDGSLFKAFKDAAPDRWGKKLMRHHERNRAAEAGTQPRTLLTADFLIGVNDETRLGALRFKDGSGGEFVSQSANAVPPILELRHLLSASDRLDRGRERKGDLALVLVPGGSLGGARPKAVVRDKDGSLCMAKFPKSNDEWPVIQWEIATLQLAQDAGIEVPPWRAERIGTKTVLLTRRFDREQDAIRLPFMSMMTALDADDGEDRSYLELVDAIRVMGSNPDVDTKKLWRRIIFNVLVCNTDDHARNHAFLRRGGGWRLSPAYDMNPCPVDVNARVHALAINELDHQASLELVLETHRYYGITRNEAVAIAQSVAESVARWRNVATKIGIKQPEIDRLASAFEHGDIEWALALPKILAPKKKPTANAAKMEPKHKVPPKRSAKAKKTRGKKLDSAKRRAS
jgi:serine/threonine-protein kinase HipA